MGEGRQQTLPCLGITLIRGMQRNGRMYACCSDRGSQPPLSLEQSADATAAIRCRLGRNHDLIGGSHLPLLALGRLERWALLLSRGRPGHEADGVKTAQTTRWQVNSRRAIEYRRLAHNGKRKARAAAAQWVITVIAICDKYAARRHRREQEKFPHRYGLAKARPLRSAKRLAERSAKGGTVVAQLHTVLANARLTSP
jgi:hypothetical protein